MKRHEDVLMAKDYDMIFDDEDMVNFVVILKYEYYILICTTDRSEAFKAPNQAYQDR